MMKQTVTARKLGLLVAGALALISQSAAAGDAGSAITRAAVKERVALQDVITVTARRPDRVPVAPLGNQGLNTGIDALRESIERQIDRDFDRRLETIGRNRVELVISEVPTRG